MVQILRLLRCVPLLWWLARAFLPNPRLNTVSCRIQSSLGSFAESRITAAQLALFVGGWNALSMRLSARNIGGSKRRDLISICNAFSCRLQFGSICGRERELAWEWIYGWHFSSICRIRDVECRAPHQLDDDLHRQSK